MKQLRKPKNGNVITKKQRIIDPNKARVIRRVLKTEARQKMASAAAKKRKNEKSII